LIPKKGELGSIKNWRPISLLNNIYKVLSKALNNRLKKISARVLSRAQKGFTQDRYIQECIINIIESISHANANKVPSFVLALDMAKAFDTVQHKFLHAVYKFFGLGERFIGMIETLTTNRNACIIWDDGTLSDPFDLGTGNGQGNAPSPLQFNMAFQILLFKFELDPLIKSIYALSGPEHILPTLAPFAKRPFEVSNVELISIKPGHRAECDAGTGKVEAFADDGTGIGQAEEGAIASVKNNLEQFSVISGLHCNVEKSQIMCIGTDIIPDCIVNSGFQVCNKLRILGFDIDSRLENLESNFVPVIEKILRIRNFWSRFNLSLAGRIGIAKSLMLSQISYCGCILNPSQDQLNMIRKIIAGFVVGKLNIAQARVFIATEKNGCGMIDPEQFIVAQQAAWIKKINGNIIDNWRRTLWWLCGGNIKILDPQLVDKTINPVIYNISLSYKKFKTRFYRLACPIEDSYVMCNPELPLTRNSSMLVDFRLFKNVLNHNLVTNLSKLKISDISENLFLNRKTEIEEFLNTDIDLVTYMRLSEAFEIARIRHIVPEPVQFPTLDRFLDTRRKGSKPFRRILSDKKINLSQERNLKTFCDITGTGAKSEKILKQICTNWDCHFMPNKIRDFAFKFYNNTLGLNSRVKHFNLNINESCTFCVLKKNFPAQRETFLHLFFDCEYTNSLHTLLINKFLPDLQMRMAHRSQLLNLIFYAMTNESNDYFFLRIFIITWNYVIWECKLNKHLISPHIAFYSLVHYMKKMLCVSARLRYELDNCNLLLCREWNEHARGGR
jgi:Reverse transcriptase (RNA-dependent DNA polymerase)